MDITEKSSVSSMTNALRLLNLFTMDEPEWTLSDLAEALNVGVSTAYRLTNTLIHEGFIVRDSDNEILSFRIFHSTNGALCYNFL